eukprot:77807-Chlamydomonas_euryale.AAC.3
MRPCTRVPVRSLRCCNGGAAAQSMGLSWNNRVRNRGGPSSHGRCRCRRRRRACACGDRPGHGPSRGCRHARVCGHALWCGCVRACGRGVAREQPSAAAGACMDDAAEPHVRAGRAGCGATGGVRAAAAAAATGAWGVGEGEVGRIWEKWHRGTGEGETGRNDTGAQGREKRGEFEDLGGNGIGGGGEECVSWGETEAVWTGMLVACVGETREEQEGGGMELCREGGWR